MPRRNISIGDLVKLRDDSDLSVGVGLVLAEKDSNSFAEEIREYYEEDPNYIEEIEEFLLYQPIYLVLWQGEVVSPSDHPVWMFVTELDLIEAQENN
tara:strand:- start:252 stop:542 length:291 start_codon:yes stop_codon:yes gene_type:complete